MGPPPPPIISCFVCFCFFACQLRGQSCTCMLMIIPLHHYDFATPFEEKKKCFGAPPPPPGDFFRADAALRHFPTPNQTHLHLVKQISLLKVSIALYKSYKCHIFEVTSIVLHCTGADPGFSFRGRTRLCVCTHIMSGKPEVLTARVQGPLKVDIQRYFTWIIFREIAQRVHANPSNDNFRPHRKH